MKYEPFFKSDPQIKWTKVRCPICNQPTGPKSECYRLIDPKDSPEHRRALNHPQLGILPLFSENCTFRSENQWQAEINYPVSLVLIKQLQQIHGLERVYPLKTYTFQISIGNLFDEKEIKSQINHIYKTFIKEMQVSESQLMLETEQEPLIVGVIMPNGKEIKATHESLDDKKQQSIIFQNILDEFPDAKPILEEKIVKAEEKS